MDFAGVNFAADGGRSCSPINATIKQQNNNNRCLDV
jgi:hypothetical protein